MYSMTRAVDIKGMCCMYSDPSLDTSSDTRIWCSTIVPLSNQFSVNKILLMDERSEGISYGCCISGCDMKNCPEMLFWGAINEPLAANLQLFLFADIRALVANTEKNELDFRLRSNFFSSQVPMACTNILVLKEEVY